MGALHSFYSMAGAATAFRQERRGRVQTHAPYSCFMCTRFRGDSGETALHWAAYKGSLEAVKLLASLGLDVRQKARPCKRSILGNAPLSV